MLNISNSSERKKGILFATLTALVWGFLALKLKLALQFIDPLSLVWARFFFALVMLLMWMNLMGKKLSLNVRPIKWIVPCALGLGLNYLGFLKGVELSGPVTAQVIIQVGPLLLSLAGVILFKEKISRKQLLGVFFLAPGFYLFYSEKIQQASTFDLYNKGSLFILFGAISWAIYGVFQKLLVQKNTPENINLFIFAFCSCLYLPVTDFPKMVELSFWPILLVILLGLNTLLAYSFVGEALKRVEANLVGVIITLNPLITVATVLILETLGIGSFGPENLTFKALLGIFSFITGAIIFVYFGMPNKDLPINEQAHNKIKI
ncbi:MAG: DMT family transporter [Bacteriovoracaceae bacterium]